MFSWNPAQSGQTNLFDRVKFARGVWDSRAALKKRREWPIYLLKAELTCNRARGSASFAYGFTHEFGDVDTGTD